MDLFVKDVQFYKTHERSKYNNVQIVTTFLLIYKDQIRVEVSSS